MDAVMDETVVALVQLDVEPGDRDRNLAGAARWIAEAASAGATFVVLPELWCSGYALERAVDLSDPLDEGPFAAMQAHATRYGVWLVASLLERSGGNVFNTLAVYAPDGRRVGSYRKTHLFELMDEPAHLRPSDTPVIGALPFGHSGLAICYDLRFPRLFDAYAEARCEVLLVTAEWPNPCLEHWWTLLRARAIGSQSFAIVCNRVGGSWTTFLGHSIIVDPWGEVIAEGDEREGCVVGRVVRGRVAEIRERFPFPEDRRHFDDPDEPEREVFASLPARTVSVET